MLMVNKVFELSDEIRNYNKYIHELQSNGYLTGNSKRHIILNYPILRICLSSKEDFKEQLSELKQQAEQLQKDTLIGMNVNCSNIDLDLDGLNEHIVNNYINNESCERDDFIGEAIREIRGAEYKLKIIQKQQDFLGKLYNLTKEIESD